MLLISFPSSFRSDAAMLLSIIAMRHAPCCKSVKRLLGPLDRREYKYGSSDDTSTCMHQSYYSPSCRWEFLIQRDPPTACCQTDVLTCSGQLLWFYSHERQHAAGRAMTRERSNNGSCNLQVPLCSPCPAPSRSLAFTRVPSDRLPAMLHTAARFGDMQLVSNRWATALGTDGPIKQGRKKKLENVR